MKNDVLISKAYYKLLIPTMLTNLVSSVGSFADTIILGNMIGENALVAMTFNAPLFTIINTIAAIFAVGGTTLMGQYLGSGNKESSCKIFSLVISSVIFIGFLMTTLGLFFIDDIMYALGSRGEVFHYTKAYGIIIIAGIVVFLINVIFAFFIRMDGKPKLAMAGMLTSIALNIILDLLFVGPLEMGVAGASLALVISQVVSIIIMSTHFLTASNTLRFKFYLSIKDLIKISKTGIGTSTTFIYQSIALFVLNNVIFTLSGTIGMATYTVIYNVSLLSLTLFEGISQTIQPLVSFSYGEQNSSDILIIIKKGLKTGIIFSFIVIAFLEIFPQSLIFLFGIKDSSIITSSIYAIRIYAIGIVLMTVNVIMSYYYQSTGKEKFAALIVLSRNLIALFIGVSLFGLIFKLNGIWFGFVFAEILTSIMWIAIANYYKKKKACKSIFLTDVTSELSLSFETNTANYKKDTKNIIKEHVLKENLSKNLTNYILSIIDISINQLSRNNTLKIFINKKSDDLTVVISNDSKVLNIGDKVSVPSTIRIDKYENSIFYGLNRTVINIKDDIA
ncbi:MATE family efflux transporter [Vallitalea guaymasensis]|uniref:MATE family efflux transporter n=1 Tax=Vallitalea guaymasensis TaxID=1185412 RepID=UPI00272D18CC|nr:MATE family efflux transporter [Vallitalea guaymasensis]